LKYTVLNPVQADKRRLRVKADSLGITQALDCRNSSPLPGPAYPLGGTLPRR